MKKILSALAILLFSFAVVFHAHAADENYYSATGANSPVDGAVTHEEEATYSGAHDATSATANYGDSNINGCMNNQKYLDGTWKYAVCRSMLCFDTSNISTDTISSGTLSVYIGAHGNADSDLYNIVSAAPSSTATIANTDFALAHFGATKLATDINISDLAYNKWTLNATGLAYINKTGITCFGLRTKNDIENTAPTGNTYTQVKMVDSGTGTRPILTIGHAASATPTTRRRIFIISFVRDVLKHFIKTAFAISKQPQ